MAIDYVGLLAKVRALIRDNGREVTLVKHDNTPTDANKPWRGSTGSDTEKIVIGVIGTYKASEVDGELIIRGDKQLLVDGDNAISLQGYDQLKDGSTTWNIVGYDEVKPADVVLLFKIQVRQ